MYAAVDGNKNPAPVNGHPPENQHDKRWKIQHLSRCISYFSHGYFSNVILVFRGVHRSSYYFAGQQDILRWGSFNGAREFENTVEFTACNNRDLLKRQVGLFPSRRFFSPFFLDVFDEGYDPSCKFF